MNHSYNRNLFSNNNSSFNVTNSNNTTNNYTTVSDEECRILSWISPLESWRRHSDVARTRAEGVGEWVLKSSEFQTWCRNRNDRSVERILFGCGAPGAGKTFICSLVVDTLCDGTEGTNAAVGCLYCDYRGQKEQTVEVMIGSLLRQFVVALPEIPETIKQAFRAARTNLGGRTPELARLIELFPEVLGRFQQVFICVDALDEFVAEYRAGFLRSLRKILDKSANIKLFLTARPHIQPELESSIPLNMRIITIQPLFSDLEKYLATKLDTDPHPRAMDGGLRSEILTKIPRESSEIFLLVTLQVDSILREITIGGRRKKLREMTNGLSDAYTTTLERVKRQRGTLPGLGLSALMWISSAERPLLTHELCHALAIEVGSPNIDTEMVPPIETVVASCMGLITVDHASSTVRLVHATLEEYLRNHQENIFQDAHATIAEACLSYLGTQSVRELPSDSKTVPHTFPLLAYASSHWGAHARKEFTRSVGDLALGILAQYPQHPAANMFLSYGGAPPYSWRGATGFSGLHYVAYFGIDELLEELLSMEQAGLNQTDEWGRTPLILAAERGNEGVVRILLSRADVNPNLPDGGDRTPLFQASANGHEGVVKTLLSRADVNPNSPDGSDQTPLFQASANGHEAAVRTLLSRADVNPNSPDWDDRTPLFVACINGHEGIVRTLLSHSSLNPNSANGHGQTPLFAASANGHKEAVATLLSHLVVNPNLPDERDRTPLFQASANGHEGAVSVLLCHASVSPNSRDWYGQTPLLPASANGHEAVVGMLLSRADINPNSSDVSGRTPLFQASANGHEAVVRMLLSHANVNRNPPDEYDRTPLLQASANGHEAVVRTLLRHADVNPNSADRYGQTPLLQASAKGHKETVRTLLSRADVNPNLPNPSGQTPLLLACEKGHEGVVRILLRRVDVNPNLRDGGGTPLSCSCTFGHEGVVKILLRRADVDPNLPDFYGRTPLHIATIRRRDGIANLLRTRL